jgi:hypothetical protein
MENKKPWTDGPWIEGEEWVAIDKRGKDGAESVLALTHPRNAGLIAAAEEMADLLSAFLSGHDRHLRHRVSAILHRIGYPGF